MLSSVLSRVIILVSGVLYPAYASFKAVKTRNMRSYVKWMIYWIVFSLFTSLEVIADMFVTWIPFYYEMKILAILWLVSPASNGCLKVYKNVVAPLFQTRERMIDRHIASVGRHGYNIIWQLGTYMLKFATNIFLQGHSVIIEQMKRSLIESGSAEESISVDAADADAADRIHHTAVTSDSIVSPSSSSVHRRDVSEQTATSSTLTSQQRHVSPLSSVTGYSGSYYERYVASRQLPSSHSSVSASSR